MSGFSDLLQQILTLTTNVARLQSDFSKLEKDHEALLEKFIALSVRVERLGATAEKSAIKEASEIAHKAGSSMQGALMTEILELNSRVQHLESSGAVVEHVQSKPAIATKKSDDEQTGR